MSSANVLPSAPAYGDREETQLYPSLPTNAENFRLTEISKIEKEISAEAEHYRLVLKKYKKVRKVIHYSVVCLGAVTAALSSGAVATSLTGVGIVIGAPVAAVAGCQYKDSYSKCPSWAGHCKGGQWQSFMKQYCKATCFCKNPGSCSDKHQNCQAWKQSGYCRGQYQAYMSTNCKKSCGIC
ncbi:hypothetical protein ACROYT_G019972 [Oculina patagonica]